MKIFQGFGQTAIEIFFSLIPIVLIFILMNAFFFKLKKEPRKKIYIGFFFTYIGLVLFMHGVHIAYVPIGKHLGLALAHHDANWLLVPIGFLIGFLIAFAEPAVHVMVKQVEMLTTGAIKSHLMLMTISLGVATAVALSMLRLLIGFSLWWIIVPGYIIVFVLGKKVDRLFLTMAFDNGGVATGPMCSTFIVSFSVAVATGLEGMDPLLDGFGVVALIALAPIISTIILGYVYQYAGTHKNKKLTKQLED